MDSLTTTDALGRRVELPGEPRRIVSLVPSITETLFAFGLGERVAGVTRFCVEPAADVAQKEKIGGTKNVDVQRTLALEPDLVIANVEENERRDIEKLQGAGVPVFVTYPRTVAQGIQMMRDVAALTGTEAAAEPFIADAEAELAVAVAANETRAPLRVFCPIWRNPWLTIGPDTYMHDFLAVCGGRNVFANRTVRYPQVTLLETARKGPQVILLPDEPYRFGQKHVAEFEVYAQVPAVLDKRIYLLDGKLLCWYGHRIAGSLRSVQALLHGGGG